MYALDRATGAERWKLSTRAKEFPGAGGSGSQAGAKIQLVWEYKSHTFDHFALIPWNVPDSTYVDTVVELARAGSLRGERRW